MLQWSEKNVWRCHLNLVSFLFVSFFKMFSE